MNVNRSLYYFFALGALTVSLLAPSIALAHPGRTDSSGGHYCRTNCAKWGLGQEEYHKHNASGGYTNSKGQTFDSAGNPVGGSSPTSAGGNTSKASPTLTPAPVKAQTPAPTPTEQGEILGTKQEPSQTPERLPEEPSPTSTRLPEATETPTPENELEDERGGGGAAATLGTLAVLGGGGYYLYRRFRK